MLTDFILVIFIVDCLCSSYISQPESENGKKLKGDEGLAYTLHPLKPR